MDGWRRAKGLGAVAVLAALAAGCSREDADRLGRVSRNGADRAEAWVADATSSLTAGKSEVPADGAGDAALAARVSARLRWDKGLAGAGVEVVARGDVVELRGSVADLGQRRRAVDLATSTVGVAEVKDLTQIPEAPNTTALR
jgi:hypothetical protein